MKTGLVLVCVNAALALSFALLACSTGDSGDTAIAEEASKTASSRAEARGNAVVEAASVKSDGKPKEVSATPDATQNPHPDFVESDEPMLDDERFHDVLLKVHEEHEKYTVTRDRFWGIELCAGPPPATVRGTTQRGAHGKKEAYYFAKRSMDYDFGGFYLVAGGKVQVDEETGSEEVTTSRLPQEQQVGQAIVKKAGNYVFWQEGEDDTGIQQFPYRIEVTKGDDPDSDTYRKLYFRLKNYFIMTKLDPDTPGTDEGWVYGVVNPKGEVTASGKIMSCMSCHQKGTRDRMFGLQKALKVEYNEHIEWQKRQDAGAMEK